MKVDVPPKTGLVNVVITSFAPEYRHAFESLNLEWLERFNLLEEEDLKYLHDPEGCIVRPGGQVFFALAHGNVVGTCAAIKLDDRTFELAKLAVAPFATRQGLGRRLSITAIQFAATAGAERVVLTSNSVLKEAIALYESLGFVHCPMPADVRYRTANVSMVKHLTEST